MSLLSQNQFTRRTFLSTAATGYALATSPIAAWAAITTPADNLETKEVHIPSGKDSLPAYFARPKKAGLYPVVLVIQEIFGVHAYIQDICRRLAQVGYAAIAPSLYFRQGDATKIADIQKLIADIVSKVPQSQVLDDLDATVAWLKTVKEADTKRIGITGFCWGGNVVWMYAARNPHLKAGVAWYGRLTGEKSAMSPVYPLDIAANLNVPVLGLYGAEDTGIPVSDVEKMRAELKKGKSGSEIIVYKGAGHAFHADYRPSYHEASAKQGWEELLKWFKSHGLS